MGKLNIKLIYYKNQLSIVKSNKMTNYTVGFNIYEHPPTYHRRYKQRQDRLKIRLPPKATITKTSLMGLDTIVISPVIRRMTVKQDRLNSFD